VTVENLTRGHRVYEALRNDIMAGRLAPGTQLPFAELGRRYRTSIGVLREGLSRLAEQGLVRAEPRHGFQVTPLSGDDLAELTVARCEIEVLLLRLAIRHGTLEWESRLLAAHHTLDGTPETRGDDTSTFSEVWITAHAQFHAVIFEGCPNSWLRAIAARLRDSAEIYTHWWARSLGHDERRDLAIEHKALVDALIARDVEGATRVITTHIQRTAAVFFASTGNVDSGDDASI
jgi:DNA-binding GntR family transcriptional regulator